MAESRRERTIARIFRYSLILKGIDSLAELVGGLALYFVSGAALLGVIRTVTRSELLEDPNDFIATQLLHAAHALALDQKTAAAIYLASHGAIKLFLVIMVLRERPWAYPVFLVALVLLIAYQSYQLSLGFALWLAVVTVFDVLILILTWHEYRHHRAAHDFRRAEGSSTP